MNYWRSVQRDVLLKAAEGSFYAGAGYGADFEEAWRLHKKGFLETVLVARVTHLQITPAGREELLNLNAEEDGWP